MSVAVTLRSGRIARRNAHASAQRHDRQPQLPAVPGTMRKHRRPALSPARSRALPAPDLPAPQRGGRRLSSSTHHGETPRRLANKITLPTLLDRRRPTALPRRERLTPTHGNSDPHLAPRTPNHGNSDPQPAPRPPNPDPRQHKRPECPQGNWPWPPPPGVSIRSRRPGASSPIALGGSSSPSSRLRPGWPGWPPSAPGGA
jgi:hypothetical protein